MLSMRKATGAGEAKISQRTEACSAARSPANARLRSYFFFGAAADVVFAFFFGPADLTTSNNVQTATIFVIF